MVLQRDPGGRITIFSVISLMGAMAGAWAGAWLGKKLGWPFAVIGGAIGWVVGLLPGRFLGDYGIMSLVRELNSQDTSALRERLKADYTLAHLITLVLVQRGEPRDPLIFDILEMLLDANPEKRWAAWRALGLNFPEVSAKLEGINPREAPENYRVRVEQLKDETLAG